MYIHIFLTSALVGGEWSASRPGRFTAWIETPVPIDLLDRWLDDTQSRLDDMEE
jgi:hypothetical protein